MKKQLLALENKALKALHNKFNYDFEKSYAVLKHSGRFTVNQIKKLAAENGYDVDSSLITVLVKSYGYCLDVAKITPCAVIVDLKYIDARRLSTFYAKSQFEAIRKRDDIETFIVCQKNADLAPENKHEINRAERFKLVDYSKYHKKNGAEYAHNVELKRTDDDGRTVTIHGGNYIYESCEKPIDEIIDKSGYLLEDKRGALKSAAAKLHAERSRAAFLNSDNSGRLHGLREALETKKAAIIAEINAATTGAEMKKAAEKITNWSGLAGLFDDLERLEKAEHEKDLTNIATWTQGGIDAFNNRFNAIKGGIEKL